MIAVVQNEVKAPALLAIAFPGTPNLVSAGLSFPRLSQPDPASYLHGHQLDFFAASKSYPSDFEKPIPSIKCAPKKRNHSASPRAAPKLGPVRR